MRDLIDRDETKKSFCEKCKGYYDGHCIHRVECDVDVIETAPSVMTWWIRCSERMPDEPGIHVLVTDGIHIMESWYEVIDGEKLWVDNYTMYVNIRFGKVTHWMPMLELPKEVD